MIKRPFLERVRVRGALKGKGKGRGDADGKLYIQKRECALLTEEDNNNSKTRENTH
jgi:hypothetical protein